MSKDTKTILLIISASLAGAFALKLLGIIT
jgi:hypothetical protein